MKKNNNILLVEDNANDQFLFIFAIKKIDISIIYDVANNGKEALDKLDNRVVPPDLIFMDINMPEMNGIECLSEIKKRPHTKDIPVVMLSTDTSAVEFSRTLGAQAFIKKPIEFETLHERLEEMLNLDFIADGHIAERTFKTALSAF